MALGPQTTTTAIRQLALARLISVTGSTAAFAALNYVVYQRTHSSTWLAATLLLTFGTVAIAAPAGGAVGDRFDRKRVMVTSHLAAAAVFAAMAFVDPVWLLVLLAFAGAIFETSFGMSSVAAIPNLVPEERLTWANSTLEVSGQLGFLIGPLIGGALVSLVGVRVVFLGNAASFLASAALCGAITGRFSAAREDRPGWSVLTGVRFLFRDRILRGIAIIYFAISLGIGITMVANVPLADSFRVGSFGYGALIAVWGGGSMLGALVARGLRSQSEPVGFFAACGLVGLAAAAVGIAPWFSLVLLGLLLMGLGDGIAAVASAGMLQRLVPDEIRSRVVGGLGSFLSIGLVCSYLVAAPILSVVGGRGSYLLGGLVALGPMPFLLRTFAARRGGLERNL